jgi:cinnamyl-alcohol dehydrogenase
MDGIIKIVSAGHPIVPLLDLLRPLGYMVVVGAPIKLLELPPFAIIRGGKLLAMNGIGNITDYQAMLDFTREHDITAGVEVIKIDYVNMTIERLERNDVRYCFVIDVVGCQLQGSAVWLVLSSVDV